MTTTTKTERIKRPGGTRFAVSQRSGDGMPVLFLNSVGADHTMWDAVRDRMTRGSVAYDARGHGASDVTPGRLAIADLAADAIAIMNATGLDRAILCGLSLGGLTAMQVAADAPDRVSGLILSNTATSFGPPSLWQDRAQAARSGGWPDLVEPTLLRWVTEDWRQKNPEGAAHIVKMLEAMPPEGYAAACAALETGDTSEALKAWSGPTLIIAGAHDQSATVERAEEMQALAPQAELLVLDTAHIAAIEDPDGFAAAIDRFATNIEAADG